MNYSAVQSVDLFFLINGKHGAVPEEVGHSSGGGGEMTAPANITLLGVKVLVCMQERKALFFFITSIKCTISFREEMFNFGGKSKLGTQKEPRLKFHSL